MAKEKISDKSKTIALVFSIIGFLGVAGIHRFYVGKIGTGVLWLLTGGILGVGTLVDLIIIAMGNFKDKNNAFLRKN
jgi:TM2 domain-containing membrane protein YozV